MNPSCGIALKWLADSGFIEVERKFTQTITAVKAVLEKDRSIERFNRTLQTEWAYHDVFLDNAARTAALDLWLDYYKTERAHTALGSHPPISRIQSPT